MTSAPYTFVLPWTLIGTKDEPENPFGLLALHAACMWAQKGDFILLDPEKAPEAVRGFYSCQMRVCSRQWRFMPDGKPCLMLITESTERSEQQLPLFF